MGLTNFSYIKILKLQKDLETLNIHPFLLERDDWDEREKVEYFCLVKQESSALEIYWKGPIDGGISYL